MRELCVLSVGPLLHVTSALHSTEDEMTRVHRLLEQFAFPAKMEYLFAFDYRPRGFAPGAGACNVVCVRAYVYACVRVCVCVRVFCTCVRVCAAAHACT